MTTGSASLNVIYEISQGVVIREEQICHEPGVDFRNDTTVR